MAAQEDPGLVIPKGAPPRDTMSMTAVLLAALSMAAIASGTSAPTLTAGIATPPHGLLWCKPLASDSVTQIIGSSGGTLKVGPHALVVPVGALSGPVSITAVVPSDTVNLVRFHPEGLTFQQPAHLIMSYANCPTRGSMVQKQITQVSDSLATLGHGRSSDNPNLKAVTGQLNHFSNYAIAW